MATFKFILHLSKLLTLGLEFHSMKCLSKYSSQTFPANYLSDGYWQLIPPLINYLGIIYW